MRRSPDRAPRPCERARATLLPLHSGARAPVGPGHFHPQLEHAMKATTSTRFTSRRRPRSCPSPEELGTMLAVGGRAGEDPRLDAGLVAAALDRPYAIRVHLRVRDLRTRPYHPLLDAFVWAAGLVAGTFVAHVFGML